MADDNKKWNSREERYDNDTYGVFNVNDVAWDGNNETLPFVVGNKYTFNYPSGKNGYQTGIYQGIDDKGNWRFSNGQERPEDYDEYLKGVTDTSSTDPYKWQDYKDNLTYEEYNLTPSDYYDSNNSVGSNERRIYNYDPTIDDDVHVKTPEEIRMAKNQTKSSKYDDYSQANGTYDAERSGRIRRGEEDWNPDAPVVQSQPSGVVTPAPQPQQAPAQPRQGVVNTAMGYANNVVANMNAPQTVQAPPVQNPQNFDAASQQVNVQNPPVQQQQPVQTPPPSPRPNSERKGIIGVANEIGKVVGNVFKHKEQNSAPKAPSRPKNLSTGVTTGGSGTVSAQEKYGNAGSDSNTDNFNYVEKSETPAWKNEDGTVDWNRLYEEQEMPAVKEQKEQKKQEEAQKKEDESVVTPYNREYSKAHNEALQNERRNTSPSYNPAVSRPTTFEDFRKAFDDNEEELARKSDRRAKIAAIGDALRHIGNLGYTIGGAVPQEYRVSPAMAEREQYKADRKEREQNMYQQYKMKQDAEIKRAQMDANKAKLQAELDRMGAQTNKINFELQKAAGEADDEHKLLLAKVAKAVADQDKAQYDAAMAEYNYLLAQKYGEKEREAKLNQVKAATAAQWSSVAERNARKKVAEQQYQNLKNTGYSEYPSADSGYVYRVSKNNIDALNAKLRSVASKEFQDEVAEREADGKRITKEELITIAYGHLDDQNIKRVFDMLGEKTESHYDSNNSTKLK